MLKKSLLLALLLVSGSLAHAKDINIAERGAIGDGVFDNWEIIQKAIDEVINSGGGTVHFPKGTFAFYDKSILIWGSNLTIRGLGKEQTTLLKKGKPGTVGDAIGITGLIHNTRYYYGQWGTGNYKQLYAYTGPTKSANNIRIAELHIASALASDAHNRKYANNIGIVNGDNIVFSNILVSDAPQTNVAMVNVKDSAKNGKIQFINSEFRNSGSHNVRVISYNSGPYSGNQVAFDNCRFINVTQADQLTRELKGQKVHLWYRGDTLTNDTSLSVKNSYFDDTGTIVTTQSAKNFSIQNSTIESYINLSQGTQTKPPFNVDIRNNTFTLKPRPSAQLRSQNPSTGNGVVVAKVFGERLEAQIRQNNRFQ